MLPAQAPPERLELLEAGPRGDREGHVPRMQVGGMADLVDEHAAAVAALVLVRPEHEVVEDQLAPALEQVRECDLPLRALELIVLLDLRPRQPAPLRGKLVAPPRQLLLLRPETLLRGLPFLGGHHLREIHPVLLPSAWRFCISQAHRTTKS